MKLLFDENLSPRLPQLLSALFPVCVHVRDCGLKGRSDKEVWEYARDNGFAIVSKDSDFYQRSLLYGPPPKLIWLRIGNCSRSDLVNLISTHEKDILALDADPLESVLVIS
jgi:predicted nuclease of predicted toxin-antitoxin system